MNVKVSVIVPVYNVEKYLPACLDSLVNQTLKDIEILVVNDGSPDNSQEIIDDYARKYPELIRAFRKENGGLSDTRNFAMRYAEGEYIAFMDSDDYAADNMCELMFNKAAAEHADVAVCNYFNVNENEIAKERIIITNEEVFGKSVEESPEILLQSKSYACNKIYRREWLRNNGFQFPVGQWFEDSAAVYNLLYKANKVVCLNECLYYYRNARPDSITNSTSDKRLFDIFKSCEAIHVFYYSHTQNRAILDVVDRVCQIHLFVRFQHLYKTGSLKTKILFYRRMLNFFDRYIPKWTSNPYFKKAPRKPAYMKFIHKPLLMYASFFIPNRVIGKVLSSKKRKSKKKGSNYYISKDRVRELQQIEYKILKEIDRICQRHGIAYCLGEETLLGAIKYHGFVPWEDQLTVIMMREEYNRLLALFSSELSSDYDWQNNEKDVSCCYPYTKVISNDNHGFINKSEKGKKKNSGPYVQIMPLDYLDSDREKAIEKVNKKIARIRQDIMLKNNYTSHASPKKKIRYYWLKCRTNQQLQVKLQKEMQRYDASSEYVCNFSSSINPGKPVPARAYGEPVYADFEDAKYPVPADAAGILEKMLGKDCLKDPPVCKRKKAYVFEDRVSISRQDITKPAEDEQFRQESLAEIRRLQEYELVILKEVDRVCKENNITYYLGEGTLLGAVRNSGFIPWDDDVDILMPRADMEKFFAICDEKLNPRFRLQYYHNVDRYWVQSPKVRLLDETEFTQSKLKQYTPDVGPYIDIFPLDNAPASFRKLTRQDKYIKRYRRILFIKTGFSKPKNKKQKLYQMYARFISCRAIHEKIKKKATKYNKTPTGYLCNFGSYYSIRQETFPESVFGEPALIRFEDSMFCVPKDPGYVLSNIYGDYMTPPPRNKQMPQHSFG